MLFCTLAFEFGCGQVIDSFCQFCVFGTWWFKTCGSTIAFMVCDKQELD